MTNCLIDSTINKNKCQKFTDPVIADEMLDYVGYKDKLFGKKVLENSFGSGVFLEKIVSRYIKSSLSEGYSAAEINVGLADDIFGFEVDLDLFYETILKMDSITDSYGIPKVKWTFFCHDSLSFQLPLKFDYIIGNPPYLNYKSMSKETRVILRNSFKSCKTGKFDYCYAFLEKAYSDLNDNGKLIQLVPANIYKNVFGENLRKLLIKDTCEIWEYPEKSFFIETMTTSSILLVKKKSNRKTVTYHNMTEKKERHISKKTLGPKWFFDFEENKTNSIRFGDHFNVSISVATLLNEAFIVNSSIISAFSLEHDLLRNAASPRSLLFKREEKIIFPYNYDSNRIVRFSEERLSANYPNIYKYLREMYYSKLIKRDSDRNASWFEFGRSQALSHLNCRKLLLSTIVTEKPALYVLDSNTVPYSGIFITEKSMRFSLEDAMEWLLSDSFYKYVYKVGTSINGKSKRITCDDIKDFEVASE